jgi:hypothetical protein
MVAGVVFAVLCVCAAATVAGETAYQRDGVSFPLKVLDSTDQSRYLTHFNHVESQQPGGRFGTQTMNLHFTDAVLSELAHHPSVLQHAERLTGLPLADLRILSTTIFCKYRTSTNVSAVVGWHQDLTYWELVPQEAWGLWIAIDEATADGGALVYAAGLHAAGQLKHLTNPADNTNVLMAKQSIPPHLIKGAPMLCAELRPGEAVFHTGWTPHMSPPNYAQKRRLAFLVNFVTSGTELLPFSKEYTGNAEWRKPVLADDATFPPAITAVVKQQTAGHCDA